jgi:ABC-type transport system involved in multi-copper enzyme maturation permease subunit
MAREFEILTKPSAPAVAVKRGFFWPGFLFILAVGIGLSFVHAIGHPIPIRLSALAVALVLGLRGNSWRSQKYERNGYGFVGIIPARSAASAVAAHTLGRAPASRRSGVSLGFFSVPGWLQSLLAVAGLTWKAALRYRLFLVVAVLLLASVVALPLLIKDDGTAQGFTQILLTYTLSTITGLLGLSTLWLSCGTLARDIEECQIQIVSVKPVARWQIWLGKWLGIVSLDAALLALAGACIFGLLQWRAYKLPADQQQVLRRQVLVARGSAKEANMDAEIDQETDRVMKERLQQNPVSPADIPTVRKEIREQVKAGFQVAPPGYIHTWRINLGPAHYFLRDKPLRLRVKFNAAEKSASGTFLALWLVGEPDKDFFESSPMSLAPDTFHEFDIPENKFDENGVLTIGFRNLNRTTLLFPLEDGMEVLYPEGGFGLNFARGLFIILCWMGLLAAIGLAAATFLQFNVAALLSLTLLTMVFFSGTMANVVSEGTVMGSNSETGESGFSLLDLVVIPFFKVTLRVIHIASQFSPIDSLSSGRSIPWITLAQAFGKIVLVLGGFFGLFGIFIFSRRELATAQGNQ